MGKLNKESLINLWNGTGAIKDIPQILSESKASEIIGDWVTAKKNQQSLDDFIASSDKFAASIDAETFKNYINTLDGAPASAAAYAEATSNAAEATRIYPFIAD